MTLIRKSRLTRSRPIPRSETPIKKVNRKRRVSEFARAYGSKERVAWIQAQSCVICGWDGGCENAHVPSRSGAGRKGDCAKIIPLCGAHPGKPGQAIITRGDGYDIGCHASLHKLGKRLFEKAYYVNLGALAAATEERWQDYAATLPPSHPRRGPQQDT